MRVFVSALAVVAVSCLCLAQDDGAKVSSSVNDGSVEQPVSVEAVSVSELSPRDIAGLLDSAESRLRGGAQDVLRKLRQIAKTNNGLSLGDFDGAVGAMSPAATREEALILQQCFILMAEKPLIDGKQLSALFRSKREAIATISYDFSFSETPPSEDLQGDNFGTYRLRIDGGNVKLTCFSGETEEVATRKRIVGYIDGECRIYDSRNGSDGSGRIVKSDRRFDCFHGYDLMRCSGLLNSAIDLGGVNIGADLGAADLEVLPGEFDRNGYKVVVAGTPGFRHYLAPKFNFALVGAEAEARRDRATQTAAAGIPDTMSITYKFSDFKDYGNGLWLPGALFVEYASDDGKARAVSVNYRNITVNKPIAPIDMMVFPKNTHVVDEIENKAYISGTGKAVSLAPPGSSDDGAAPVAPSNRLLLIIVNVICVAVLVAAFAFRHAKRHKH